MSSPVSAAASLILASSWKSFPESKAMCGKPMLPALTRCAITPKPADESLSAGTKTGTSLRYASNTSDRASPRVRSRNAPISRTSSRLEYARGSSPSKTSATVSSHTCNSASSIYVS